MIEIDTQLSDYVYHLPQAQIPEFPSIERENSRLLVLNGRNMIQEGIFGQIPDFLPEDAFLVFNDTQVFPARLNFYKSGTGAKIEVFCLEPVLQEHDLRIDLKQTAHCSWKCLIGNLKKWKEGILRLERQIENETILLEAEKLGPVEGGLLVEFHWTPSHLEFSQILDTFGSIPLPPYIKRKTVPSDSIRYQTTYAKNIGSVAAPTAGLHFTQKILEEVKQKKIRCLNLTLHVGAGTFIPIETENISEHRMHFEQMLIQRQWVEEILLKGNREVIAVGTTTVRTLESAYWLGHQLLQKDHDESYTVTQWYPYEVQSQVSFSEAYTALLDEMNRRKSDYLSAKTQLMILPSYSFQVVTGLITNFHQPGSTLLLLVAALIGDAWKEVYQYALYQNFRFLSYGDACLFLPRHSL